MTRNLSIPLGSADVKRTGKDITIVTYSYMVHLRLRLPKYFQKKESMLK